MTRTTLTALMILVGSMGIFASPSAPRAKTLNDELKHHISFPEFAKNEKMDGLVLVEFEVSPDGTVEVTKMNASCPHLAKYVENQLEALSIEDQNALGKHFMKFNFNYVES